MRKSIILLIPFLLLGLWSVLPSFPQLAAVRYVSNSSPTCNGQAPCYATIQAAVDAVLPGEIVRIQTGQYDEAVLIKSKNKTAAATEADRILIEADPAAPTDSVVVGASGAGCTSGTVFQFASSRFVTLRGVTIRNAGPEAIRLLGANHHNTAIHIERNRIFGNGTCPGGIVIAKGNVKTVLANNLLYGNSHNGVTFAPGQGGPHYVVGNTIHGNGQNGISLDRAQEVWLVNNVITHNGVSLQAATGNGFGVTRTPAEQHAHPQLAVLFNNLLCGNGSGELSGALLDSTDKGNLTPTGQEGSGVSASPGCDDLAKVYTALNGADGQLNTVDDDFTLAANSPAIDQGIDPRTLGLGTDLDSLFTADFTAADIRPRDGDGNGSAEFDMGALEKSAPSSSSCTPGATQACYTGPAVTEGVGVCQAGTQTCGPDRAWGACVGQVLPSAEVCNGLDDNCNGQVDDALGQTTCGVGVCQRTVDNCRNGVPQTCTPGTPSQEICGNGIDDDCNGIVDDPGMCVTIPPDPVTVAPPINPTVATSMAAAVSFLYTGNNPIQAGVAPVTIDARRVAVLRGKVLDKSNAPLPGVTITILNHPEFGQTSSRTDGMFDMAVNGGGQLTVNYAKSGFIAAQRQLQTPWRDYAWLPDVVLIPYDSRSTLVDLTTNTFQVAQGSVTTDARGTRQATLLFPPGTQAQMHLPDGSIQPLTALHVHATEHSVETNGPESVAAEEPSTVAYTYGVDFTAEEALAANALAVEFNQPVILYIQNFINFPVGGGVPVGGYDATQGLWVPHNNGRVVQVLSITNGQATLDVKGMGQAASPAELATLGITDAELQEIGQLYPSGETLWRAPIPHFSYYDT